METQGNAYKGGFKFCPNSQRIMATRVKEEFNENAQVGGLHAKRRKIICGLDRAGTGGCGHEWFTVEVIENDLKAKLGIQA